MGGKLFRDFYKEWKSYEKFYKKKINLKQCHECSAVGMEDDFVEIPNGKEIHFYCRPCMQKGDI